MQSNYFKIDGVQDKLEISLENISLLNRNLYIEKKNNYS